MIELRCPHGFLNSKVRCPNGCHGKTVPLPRNRPERGSIEEAMERIENVVLEVAKEMRLSREEATKNRAGRFITGGAAPHVRAKAEITRRVRSRYGYGPTLIAKALGVSAGDLWYAVKRCG